MSNAAQEIINYIKANPNSAAEDIAEGADWNRHIVDVTIRLMLERGLIRESGTAPWGEPTYTAIQAQP